MILVRFAVAMTFISLGGAVYAFALGRAEDAGYLLTQALMAAFAWLIADKTRKDGTS